LTTWAEVGGLRIHWMTLGKGVALAGVGLLALQVLPGLLKPPAPPPLAGDVGLPRVQIDREAGVKAPSQAEASGPATPKLRRRQHLPKLPGHPGLRGGKISSKPAPHRHPRKKRRKAKQAPAAEALPTKTASPTPSPPPVPSPPSTPEPPPAPSSAPSPAPPPEPSSPAEDGSAEFAPH